MTLSDIEKLVVGNKDGLLIIALIIILSRENADKGLIFALAFLLL